MNLLIDLGNTALRWALQPPGGLPGALASVRHGGGMPLDLLAAWEQLEPPARVLASRVGDPQVAVALTRTVRACWDLEPIWATTHAMAFGVRIAYRDPARLGVDRWLALIAARALTARDCLIVDTGTAATFDLLLADGAHAGGLILPGLTLMRTALLSGTRIPPFVPAGTAATWPSAGLDRLVGRDTETAITLGGVQSLAALAARLYDGLAARTKAAPDLLLTGGDAEAVGAALERPFRLVPDLVLRGLARLADAPVSE